MNTDFARWLHNELVHRLGPRYSMRAVSLDAEIAEGQIAKWVNGASHPQGDSIHRLAVYLGLSDSEVDRQVKLSTAKREIEKLEKQLIQLGELPDNRGALLDEIETLTAPLGDFERRRILEIFVYLLLHQRLA